MSERFLVLIIRILPGFEPEPNDNKIKSILITQLHGLGDAIIFSPVLHEIKTRFNNAKITILSTHRTHEVMTNFFSELNFIRYSGLGGLRDLRKKFDLIINPARSLKNYIIDIIMMPDYLVGFNYSIITAPHENHYDRAVKLLKQLGGVADSNPDFRFVNDKTAGSCSFIERHVGKGKKTICYIVGGRWASKVYPIELSKKLIHLLAEYKNTAIVLIGSDKDQGDILARSAENVYNYCSSTTIAEVMDCIKTCDLLIGPDNGLLHFAVVFDTPFIGFFGSVDHRTVIPESYLKNILTIMNCEFQPCYNEEHKPYCPFESPKCIEIEPELIISKINGIGRIR